jgi:hypothetical protein
VYQCCVCTVSRYGTIRTVRTVLLKKDGVLAYFADRYGVRYGAKLALPVQKWPQNGLFAPKPSIFTSRMLLSCVDATQCFPGQPWGWVEAASARGKGPAVACMETQKSDAVLDSCSTICILFMKIVAKRKQSFGPKLEPNSQISVKIVLYGRTVLVRFGPYFSNIPY